MANFEDLKVLGKGDFKLLMKWRLAIRLEIGLDVKADPQQDVTEEVNIEPMDEEEEISAELKKAHEERLARSKKEKKRANEKKARELLKLQLNMTAPTDLDVDDRALGGEDEMFNLGEAEGEMSRQGRKNAIDSALQEEDGMSESEEEEESAEEDEEVLDTDEEREKRTQELEGELDGLYDEYQERMKERDAKWRVKQARLKDRNFDAWHGIKDKDGSGSEDDDGDDGVDKGYRNGMVRVPRRGDPDVDQGAESEEGGWDVVAKRKAAYDAKDSDDSSDEDEEAPSQRPRKRRSPGSSSRPNSVVIENGQRGLVTSLQDKEKRAQMSRQAQLWFDQSVFKGVGDLAALDGDESEDEESGEEDEVEEEEADEEEEEDEDEEDEIDGSDVDMDSAPEAAAGEADEDDFEIVPQAADDAPEWDVDDEDQDEVKKKIIKGRSGSVHFSPKLTLQRKVS